MRKHGFIMLLVLLLSFSVMVAAESPDGFSYSQENILTFSIVENQVVTVPVFGGVAVLSVNFSEQAIIDMYTAVSASADIGLEMETLIMEFNNNSMNNDIDGSRGGYFHFASHYQQGIFT